MKFFKINIIKYYIYIVNIYFTLLISYLNHLINPVYQNLYLRKFFNSLSLIIIYSENSIFLLKYHLLYYYL